jgi:membrane-associated phospholipid phosphatase
MSRAARSVSAAPGAPPRWAVPALINGLFVLTVAVARGWWPASLDQQVASAMPGRHASGLASVVLQVASVVTTLAIPTAAVPITLAFGVWLARHNASPVSLRMVAVPLTALTVSVLAGKALLHRPGPPGSRVHHLIGYYPSGHTATAVVCTGLLTRVAYAHRLGSPVALRAGAATWTLLVGTSLVFHRYHWLSDVVAGLLLGLLILQATRPALHAEPLKWGARSRSPAAP